MNINEHDARADIFTIEGQESVDSIHLEPSDVEYSSQNILVNENHFWSDGFNSNAAYERPYSNLVWSPSFPLGAYNNRAIMSTSYTVKFPSQIFF